MSLFSDYIQLKKWLSKRRGRLSELARHTNMHRQTLNSQIEMYVLDHKQMDLIKALMQEIERCENRAIDLIQYMKEWMLRGQGRQMALAERLQITPFALRKILKSTGHSRYSVLKYGIRTVRQAMKAIERNLKRILIAYDIS